MDSFSQLVEFLDDSTAMDIRLDIELLDNGVDDYTNIFYCDFLSHVLKKRKQEVIKSISYRIPKSDVMEIMKNPSPTLKIEPNQSLGYEEDSFIDNNEPFDECLPNDMETLLGGHYVNCGKLQLKKIVLKETKDNYKRNICQQNIGNGVLNETKASLSPPTKIVAGKSKLKISGEGSRKVCLVESKLVVPVATSDFKKNETSCWNVSENPSLKKMEIHNFPKKKECSYFKRIDASSWRISENITLKNVEPCDLARKKNLDFKKIDENSTMNIAENSVLLKKRGNPSLEIIQNPRLLKMHDNPALKVSENPSLLKIRENLASKVSENSALKIGETPALKISQNRSLKICENSALFKKHRSPALKIIENPSLLKIRETSSIKISENSALKIGDNSAPKEIKSQCFLKKQTSDYFNKIGSSCRSVSETTTPNKIESHGLMKSDIFDFNKIESCSKNNADPQALKKKGSHDIACSNFKKLDEVEPHCYGKTKTSVLKKVKVACLGNNRVTSTTKPMEASLGMKCNKALNLSKIEKRRKRQLELQLKKMWVSLPNLEEIASHARKQTVIGENLPQK